MFYKVRTDGTVIELETVGVNHIHLADATIEQIEEYKQSLEPSYIDLRMEAYGTPEHQLEWITENGLASWQAEVERIKALYPKPVEV